MAKKREKLLAKRKKVLAKHAERKRKRREAAAAKAGISFKADDGKNKDSEKGTNGKTKKSHHEEEPRKPVTSAVQKSSEHTFWTLGPKT